MKRAVFGMLFAAAAVCGAASADVALDQPTKNALEGVWMLGENPGATACVDSTSKAPRIEFEFARSGGRMAMFEPGGDVMPGPIIEAGRTGDTVTITMTSWFSGTNLTLSYRFIDPDHLDTRAVMPDAGDVAPAVLTRCGAPDRAVNGTASVDQLTWLTASKAENILFLEADAPDFTDGDICARGGPERYPGHWLAFDVFGPAYFYVRGAVGDEAWRPKLAQSPILSLVPKGPKSLTLTAGERPEGAPTWRADGTLKPFTLTLSWDGHRMTVAELGKTFVRCHQIGHRTEPAPLP